MNKQLLVFTLLLSIQSFSQDYIPMLQEGNTWSVDLYFDPFGCDQVSCKFTDTKQVSLGAAEIHNSLSYTRIISDKEPTCLLREDNYLVYRFDPDENEEKILFDYSLEIGDSFNLTTSAYHHSTGCAYFHSYADYVSLNVIDVEYIEIAGAVRKVIFFEEDNLSDLAWIEGIGNITGFDLMEPIVDIMSHSALACFSTNGESYFFNGASSCENTTVLNISSLNENSIHLFPNPVSEKATLTIPQENSSLSFIVYDVNGKKLMEQDISEESTSLDFSSFTEGMYFYQIYSENELILTRKLLVL